MSHSVLPPEECGEFRLCLEQIACSIASEVTPTAVQIPSDLTTFVLEVFAPTLLGRFCLLLIAIIQLDTVQSEKPTAEDCQLWHLLYSWKHEATV